MVDRHNIMGWLHGRGAQYTSHYMLAWPGRLGQLPRPHRAASHFDYAADMLRAFAHGRQSCPKEPRARGGSAKSVMALDVYCAMLVVVTPTMMW
jgi:hypothetical protein